MEGKEENTNADIPRCNINVDEFTKNGFKILMDATKNSNNLPKQNNWNFYKAYDSFNGIMKSDGEQILNIMHQLMQSEGISGNISRRDEKEKVELLIEANDSVLERVAINIDIMNGVRKKVEDPVLQTVSAQLPVNGSWNKVNEATFSVSNAVKNVSGPSNSNQTIRLLAGKNIIRPQKFFKDRIENGNQYLWKPKIVDKPNSLKPLAIFLEETREGDQQFSHPYQYELDLYAPKDEFVKLETCKEPKSLEETPLYEVTTPEQLNALVDELRKHKEIAIDLEHHSYRTFMGITCLMQISTCDCDYLVDTLVLRDKLSILNEVFTKPTIVKIFHGSEGDIEWLQRDLSLYIVNMFDTHQAAKLLQYSLLSLGYLLARFCKVAANKHFQLADWRIRPLPNELKLYARQDTHYLIYIYHKMKQELYEKANRKDTLVRSVFMNSNQICKRRYRKPVLNDSSHLELYRRSRKMFDNKQLYCLKHLHQWRDEIAREEDESYGYVLPNHMLFRISEILPREMQGVLACCNPIPPLVRANLLKIHEIVLKAREQPVINPILQEQNRSRGSTQQFTKINIDSPLYCPHDINKNHEFRDDLPTLLSSVKENPTTSQTTAVAVIKLEIEKQCPSITIFDTKEEEEENIAKTSNIKLKSLKFLGPYERYKLVKPFIEAEEAKRLEQQKKEKEEQAKQPERTDEDRINDLKKHFFEATRDAACGALPQQQQVSPEHNKRKRELEDDNDDANEIQMPQKVPRVMPDEDLDQNVSRKISSKQKWLNKQAERRKNKIAYISNGPVKNKRAPRGKQRNATKQPEQYTGENSNQETRSSGNRFQASNRKGENQNQSFDYSNVDYGRFQGGAGSVPKGHNVGSKFKAKQQNYRQRGNGKKNNKSFSYAPNSNQRGGNHGKTFGNK